MKTRGWPFTDDKDTQTQKPIRAHHRRNAKLARQIYHLLFWTIALLGITLGYLLEIYLMGHWQPAVELEHVKVISGSHFGSLLDLLVLLPCLLFGIFSGYLVGTVVTKSI